jgi:hypothetical protein
LALNYYDEIVTLFVDNYSLDYPVAFDDGPCLDLSGTGGQVAQPTDSPWLRVNTIGGDTFNETIGTKSSIQKNELFNLSIQVFMPRGAISNDKIYTTSDFSAVSNHLNTFLMIDAIATTDNALIIMDLSSPTSTDRIAVGPNDTWQQINLTYRYEYRYI